MATEGGEVPMTPVTNPAEEARSKALEAYKKKLLEHREVEAKVRGLRLGLRDSNKEYDKTEDDLKALQSVGQIIGELLRQLDEERCVRHLTRECPRNIRAGGSSRAHIRDGVEGGRGVSHSRPNTFKAVRGLLRNSARLGMGVAFFGVAFF